MQESEREKVRELVSGEVEEVLSCLASGSNKLAASMKRAMLEVRVVTLLSGQWKQQAGRQHEETCLR